MREFCCAAFGRRWWNCDVSSRGSIEKKFCRAGERNEAVCDDCRRRRGLKSPFPVLYVSNVCILFTCDVQALWRVKKCWVNCLWKKWQHMLCTICVVKKIKCNDAIYTNIIAFWCKISLSLSLLTTESVCAAAAYNLPRQEVSKQLQMFLPNVCSRRVRDKGFKHT